MQSFAACMTIVPLLMSLYSIVGVQAFRFATCHHQRFSFTQHHLKSYSSRNSRCHETASTSLYGRGSGKRRGGDSGGGDGGKYSRRRRETTISTGGNSSNNRVMACTKSGDNRTRPLTAPKLLSPSPTTFKHILLRVQANLCNTSTLRNPQQQFIDIAMCEVNDTDWWDAKTLLEDDANKPRKAADNPFGARAWPTALAVAQLLVSLPSSSSSSSSSNLEGRMVLELGCGIGLASIAPASLGANVLATDVSPLALELTRRGWAETNEKREKTSGKKEERKSQTSMGTLSTALFDVTSNDQLPIPKFNASLYKSAAQPDNMNGLANPPVSPTEQQPIVIATSILYEKDLARAVAARIAEAAALGAWVIVCDCDSGQRENGRQQFEEALDRKLAFPNNNGQNDRPAWMPGVVKCPELGWREKHVRMLHMNAPPSFVDR